MNGFAALDIPPCRRYVVVKATAGFAVCRLILKLLLFYSCLDFTQNLGKTLKSRWIPVAESNGILFAPNEGYGLLTLAHILDQVLLVNLPEFSHLEGGNVAAVQKTKQ